MKWISAHLNKTIENPYSYSSYGPEKMEIALSYEVERGRVGIWVTLSKGTYRVTENNWLFMDWEHFSDEEIHSAIERTLHSLIKHKLWSNPEEYLKGTGDNAWLDDFYVADFDMVNWELHFDDGEKCVVIPATDCMFV